LVADLVADCSEDNRHWLRIWLQNTQALSIFSTILSNSAWVFCNQIRNQIRNQMPVVFKI
jgi:hypothetical protein